MAKTRDLDFYFKRGADGESASLPTNISQRTIDAVNRELEAIRVPNGGSKKRGVYNKVTDEERAIVGEHAAKHGIAAAMRYFKQRFPNLKEATVRGWKNQYLKEFCIRSRDRKRGASPVQIEVLPSKRRGRPLLLGEMWEDEVKSFVKLQRDKGTVVNTQTVMATAVGVVVSHDANLLAENGGHIDITKSWATRFLERLNMVKRKGTTAAKILPTDFEKVKKQYLSDICSMVIMEDIPEDLVINWDQTGLKYVPVSDWTFAEKGSKRVEIAGLDDKRQITVLLTCTLSGKLLPTQVIYAGKTPACLPKVTYPKDWYLTYTENHWSNEQTMLGYLHNILIPYVEATRVELKLSKTHSCLVLFDSFKGQTTDNFFKVLEENNILIVEVPPNCTDRLQPLDLAVNKPLKDQMKRQFHHWYSKEVEKRIRNATNEDDKVIDLKLSQLKPLGFSWLKEACAYVEQNDFIKNGFIEAGITEALSLCVPPK